MAGKKLLLPITVELDDGAKHVCDVKMPPSYQDQAAFETQFGQSSVALDVAMREIGKAATDDASFQGALGMRARWIVFLAWRQLRRDTPGIGPFGVFEGKIEEVTVDTPQVLNEDGSVSTVPVVKPPVPDEDGSEPVDPTVPAADSAPAVSPG